jgi:NAD-dependent SIR2 family protein deacetylase
MVRNAEVLVVGTGAGMGKDSGLPDFRGNEGFWNNYPPYRGKFKFVECANPSFLHEHPHLFWGFYGHRLAMYRSSTPHRGYSILKEIANKINPSPSSPSQNYFAFTSNVDGHFQRADYPASHLYEVHGSIHHLQCYNCQ